MKINELRGLDKEELKRKLLSLKQELSKLNYQRRSGRVEKPHLFCKTRKDIARILTLLHSEEK